MERHKVGERVLWVTYVNSPGYYKPGEKIPGEVIDVFFDPPIYRIRLDICWDERVSDKSLHGKKIIVGNVMHEHILPTT